MKEETIRHLKFLPSQMLPVVLVVGDPARVDSIKPFCESYVDIAWSREYKTIECTYNNQKFLCVSHGIGSAGAAICFSELIQNGAKVIVRAGSCGSLQPKEIKRGDICVSYAAVREDRVSHMLVPADYPAVADIDVYLELLKHAEEKKLNVHKGICLTSDLYYPNDILPSNILTYSKAHVAVNDMEYGTLLTLCALNKVRAAGIFVVDGSPLKWDEGDIDVKLKPESLEGMLRAGMDTCAHFASLYKK